MANVKLTEKQILEIKDLWLNENKSSQEISLLYPVNPNHIQRVCAAFVPNGTNLRSLKSPNRKLTDFKARKIIISCLKNNEPRKDIALQYGVSVGTVQAICSGRNWPHIFQGYQKKYRKEIVKLV